MRTRIIHFVRHFSVASLVLPVLLLRMSVTTEPAGQNFWQQTNGPYGGYIGALAIDPNGNILAGAYGHGVFRSVNNGANWDPINAGLTNQSVQSLVTNSAGDFFALAGNVFRLQNGSNVWTGITNGLQNNSVTSLTINSAGQLFVGTRATNRIKVFRSIDNGDTWTEFVACLPDSFSITAFVFLPNADILVGIFDRGVFRVKSDGSTCTPVNAGLTSKSVNALAINAGGQIFAGTRGGIFRSQNYGATWVKVNTNSATNFVIKSSEQIFAAIGAGVLRSVDGGSTWTAANNGLTNRDTYTIALKSNGDIFVGTRSGVFRSSDNGDSWVEVNAGLLGFNATALVTAADGKVLTGIGRSPLGCGNGSGGFVFRSENNGNTWEKASAGLPVNDVNALVKNSKGEIFAGTTGGLYRSSDNGSTWTADQTGMGARHVRALTTKPNGEIFAGTDAGVFRSTGSGSAWHSVFSNRNILALASNSVGEVYAGADSGRVFHSTDNGNTWKAISMGLNNKLIRSLAINSRGDIFAGTNGSGIFRSIDNGNTWTAINIGLANQDILTLASHSTGLIFAGSNGGGVFTSSNNGDIWESLDSGLTHWVVYALAIDFQNFIYAGTSGGGVFRSIQPLPSEMTVKPEVAASQTIGVEFGVDITMSNVQNLFGLSFELNYTNTAYVDHVSAEPGDLLGSDIVFLPTPEDPAGKVSIGITRKSGQPGISGSGVVARLRFKSRISTPSGTPVVFSLRQVTANDPNGAAIHLTALSSTTTIANVVVWPGDTNNDSVVNQADVLPVGLYWNKTGPVRPNRSTNWTGQPATPWSPEAATYADANGDGTVNQSDVSPIGLNWGKTRNGAALANSAANFAKTLSKINVAGLCYSFTGNPSPGQEFRVEVQAAAVTSLFGIAFELLYSPAALVDPQTVEAGSFMGQDMIFLPNVDKANGKISVGISQKSPQSGASGSGVVARLKMRMAANAPAGTIVAITLQNVTANDPAGNSITITPTGKCTTTGVDELTQTGSAPTVFALHANAPNPFNPSTTINYDLAQPVEVRLMIFDLMGRRVRTLVDQRQQAGRHAITWDGRNDLGQPVASGTFIYQLRAGTFVQSRRMALLR